MCWGMTKLLTVEVKSLSKQNVAQVHAGRVSKQKFKLYLKENNL
jgi:hypothetical protein